MAATVLPYRFHAPSHRPTSPPEHGLTRKTYIVTTYQAQRLGHKQWTCEICSRQATIIYYTKVSNLSPFSSKTHDFVTATCHMSRCRSLGSSMAHHLGKEGECNGGAQTCENCGNGSRLRLCGSCTFTYNTRKTKFPGKLHRPRIRAQRDHVMRVLEPQQLEIKK